MLCDEPVNPRTPALPGCGESASPKTPVEVIVGTLSYAPERPQTPRPALEFPHKPASVPEPYAPIDSVPVEVAFNATGM